MKPIQTIFSSSVVGNLTFLFLDINRLSPIRPTHNTIGKMCMKVSSSVWKFHAFKFLKRSILSLQVSRTFYKRVILCIVFLGLVCKMHILLYIDKPPCLVNELMPVSVRQTLQADTVNAEKLRICERIVCWSDAGDVWRIMWSGVVLKDVASCRSMSES